MGNTSETRIPSVDAIVEGLQAWEKDLIDNGCLMVESSSPESSAQYWTVLEFLNAVENQVAVLYPHEYLREWDDQEKATAVFRGYLAYLKVAGREDLQQEVRLAGGLVKKDIGDRTVPYVWIEYKEGDAIRRYDPTLEFERSDRHENNLDYLIEQFKAEDEALDIIKDPTRVYEEIRPVWQSTWGSEVRFPLCQSFGQPRCAFEVGVRRGIC